MEHKQVFNELIKLASEKVAQGWGYYGGGPMMWGGRGGGFGRGGMEYYGRGGMMRMNPYMMRQLLQQMQLQQGGMGADLPNLGVGAGRQWQEYSGLQSRTPTTFRQTAADQMSRQSERRYNSARDDYNTANTAYGNAQAQVTALENQLRDAEALWRAKSTQYQTTGDMAKGWGEVVPWTTDTYRIKQEALDAGAKLQAMRQSIGPQLERARAMASDADANRRRHQAVVEQYDQSRHGREEGAVNRTADIDAQREGRARELQGVQNQRNINQQNQAQNVGARLTGQPRPPQIQQGPAAGAPGGPPAAPPAAPPQQHVPIPRLPAPPQQIHPIVPQGAGGGPPPPPGGQAAGPRPPIQPGRPAAAMLPPATMDQLVEGAARTMFDRYVKVAVAKVAADRRTQPRLPFFTKASNSNPLLGQHIPTAIPVHGSGVGLPVATPVPTSTPVIGPKTVAGKGPQPVVGGPGIGPQATGEFSGVDLGTDRGRSTIPRPELSLGGGPTRIIVSPFRAPLETPSGDVSALRRVQFHNSPEGEAEQARFAAANPAKRAPVKTLDEARELMRLNRERAGLGW